MVETYTPSLMQLTNGAVHKILSLKDSESNNDTLNLRVYVTGGGCSGFQYDFLLIISSMKMIHVLKRKELT